VSKLGFPENIAICDTPRNCYFDTMFDEGTQSWDGFTNVGEKSEFKSFLS